MRVPASFVNKCTCGRGRCGSRSSEVGGRGGRRGSIFGGPLFDDLLLAVVVVPETKEALFIKNLAPRPPDYSFVVGVVV